METMTNLFKQTVLPAALFAILLISCQSDKMSIESYDSDVIISWNEAIMDLAIAEDNLLTLKGVRTEALMHLAMHDALNSIEPVYSNYLYRGNSSKAQAIAAVVQAAYEVAVDQYPDKKEELDDELDKWLTPIKEDDSKALGIALGRSAAAEILASRAKDNYDGDAEYTWHPMAPGVYAEFNEHSGTPEGFVFGAGWAAAEPFMLPAQSHFRSPPPPDISSDAYTLAFNEVKEFGSTQSESRTDDQAHLAMWWKDFVENSHNRLARELVVKEKLNLWESARTFALLNMTIYDAYVSVFDNKFHYNHWRPYTAIRWADNDENPNTLADTSWNNLHEHTYAFPSYPSAHGCASTAAMTVLANTLGTGDDYVFTMTTEEVSEAGPLSESVKMNPPTRSFNSFSEAGLEASMSRVYLGIHFRYDSEEGHELGARIGSYANDNFLKPLKE